MNNTDPLKRDWCCGTPITEPHTPGCACDPTEDNPVDYTAVFEICNILQNGPHPRRRFVLAHPGTREWVVGSYETRAEAEAAKEKILADIESATQVPFAGVLADLLLPLVKQVRVERWERAE
jgi:hypothetical protein